VIGDLVMRASTPAWMEEGFAAAMAWGSGLGVGAALLRGHEREFIDYKTSTITD